MSFSPNAATVFRNYVMDGNPASQANNPDKAAIRALLLAYETIIDPARLEPFELTDAATIAVPMLTKINFKVTLAGNRILGNPTNPTLGMSGVIAVTQSGAGSRTLTPASYWIPLGGVAGSLSAASGAIDLIVYYVETETRIVYSILNGG